MIFDKDLLRHNRAYATNLFSTEYMGQIPGLLLLFSLCVMIEVWLSERSVQGEVGLPYTDALVVAGFMPMREDKMWYHGLFLPQFGIFL